MKILHINPSLSPVRGGPSHSTLEIVKALHHLGIDADIATTNDNGEGLLDVPLRQHCKYHSVPVWFFPRFSPSIVPLREYAFSSAFTIWLWQHITNYDLVHVHALFSYTCTAAMAIARVKGVPYIVRPNGLLCTWSLQQSTLKKKLYLSLVEQQNLNHSELIECTATKEHEEISLLNLRPPSIIIPYGVSLPKMIPNARQQLRQLIKIPPDEPIILFMSRLHYKKGLDYLIPALGKIKDQQFTFVIAGNGDSTYETEIKNLIKVAGIESKTYWAGFVTGNMKNLLLQGSDIFALTSHSESFGLAVLEAIANGLLVVTTSGVPLAETVQHHQFGYVSHLQTNAIASVILQGLSALENVENTQSRCDRARQFILEHYTWDKIAGQLVDAYEGILGDRSSIPLSPI